MPLTELGDEETLVRVCAAAVEWADATMTTGTPYLMRLGYGLRRPRDRRRRFADVVG